MLNVALRKFTEKYITSNFITVVVIQIHKTFKSPTYLQYQRRFAVKTYLQNGRKISGTICCKYTTIHVIKKAFADHPSFLSTIFQVLQDLR